MTAPHPLVWEADWLPPAEQKAEIEAVVCADLAVMDHRAPSSLVFHHISLSAGMDGPLVFVYGQRGSDAYHCRYDAAPEWVTISEGAA